MGPDWKGADARTFGGTAEKWNPSSGSALVRLRDDLFVQNTHLPDHQQAHIPNDVSGQCVIGDRVTLNIQAKSLALNAASVGELNLEVKTHAPVSHVCVPPASGMSAAGVGAPLLCCHSRLLMSTTGVAPVSRCQKKSSGIPGRYEPGHAAPSRSIR
jgi:hypothetical protein